MGCGTAALMLAGLWFVFIAGHVTSLTYGLLVGTIVYFVGMLAIAYIWQSTSGGDER